MHTDQQFTVQELADYLQAAVEGNDQQCITGIADLEAASSLDVSFLANMRYEQLLPASNAGAIVIGKAQTRPSGKNYLIVEDPSTAFQKLIELFAKSKMTSFSSFTGIHESAVIHKTAKLHEGVWVGPQAVVEAGVIIGRNSKIGAGVYLGQNVEIGEDCQIHPHVVVRENCKIGSRVILQPGAVIGSCGYGFATDAKGKHSKLEQVGIVVIEDDVEIGANTTIDRARFAATTIGQGTKIDNLVQIAHNVKVGKHNLIVSQTGIAGSTELGDHVVLGGQVAINGHIKIAPCVMVAARAGVSKSLLKAGKYNGVPAMPLTEYNRMAVHLQNIEKLVGELKALKQEVSALKSLSQK